MSYTLFVDDREKDVIPHFSQFGNHPDLEIKVKRITTGDYSLVYGEDEYVVFVIERKTWKDLSASMKDGRKDNINKLIEIRAKFSLCKLFYLIEGKPRHELNRRFSRIPFKNLQAHLDHLIIRDNIHIIYSTGIEDTPKRIIDLFNNILTLTPSIISQIPNTFASASAPSICKIENCKTAPAPTPSICKIAICKGGDELSKSHNKTDKEILVNIWSCIPNITEKTANLFIDNDIKLRSFIIPELCLAGLNSKVEIMSDADMRTLKYSSGVMIGKRFDKMIKVRNFDDPLNHKTYIKMLASINGLTKQSAELILEKYSFRDILLGSVSLEEIAGISKSEKKTIGKSVASKVVKFFSGEF